MSTAFRSFLSPSAIPEGMGMSLQHSRASHTEVLSSGENVQPQPIQQVMNEVRPGTENTISPGRYIRKGFPGTCTAPAEGNPAGFPAGGPVLAPVLFARME